MTRAEIISKLEDLARNGGSIAELNACKALLALPEFAGEAVAQDPFAALDNVAEFRAPRNKRRAA